MRFKNYDFCVEPLPGELAYSVMLRTANALGVQVPSLLKTITRTNKIKSTAISLSQRLDLYDDPEDSYYHTTLPWHFMSLTSQMQQLAVSNKINPYTINENERFVNNRNRPGLAWCSQCLKEDEDRFGTAYYHVEHQYDGLTVCPKHGSRLNIISKNRPEFDLIPKSDIQGELIEKDIANLALRAVGTSLDDWIPLLHKRYQELGLLKTNGIEREKIKDILRKCYSGTPFSDYIQFENTKSDWPILVPVVGFHSNKTVHPFKLVLLSYALKMDPPDRTKEMPEPLICPGCGSTSLAQTDRKLHKVQTINCLNCGSSFELNNTIFDQYKTNICSDEKLLEQTKKTVRELESKGEEITFKKIELIVNHSVNKSTPTTYSFLKTHTTSTEGKQVLKFLKSVRKLTGRTNIPKLLTVNKDLTKGFVRDSAILSRLNENYLKDLEEKHE